MSTYVTPNLTFAECFVSFSQLVVGNLWCILQLFRSVGLLVGIRLVGLDPLCLETCTRAVRWSSTLKPPSRCSGKFVPSCALTGFYSSVTNCSRGLCWIPSLSLEWSERLVTTFRLLALNGYKSQRLRTTWFSCAVSGWSTCSVCFSVEQRCVAQHKTRTRDKNARSD